MLSGFFIERPIFASVLSIVITLAGAIALWTLPVAQYPPITPPTVQVSCTYPGASAVVVADTIAAPIEQQVNGVEKMLYMSSQCGNDGSYNLTVTFDLDTDLNTALVMVQNRVSLAMPQLPEAVQRQGLTIKKKSPNILLVVNFFSSNGRYDALYLSNYATINVKDELFRLEGVGDIVYLGQRDYSIRVWMDPQKLAARNMSSEEVVQAIRDQNLAAAPGQVGQQPGEPGLVYQYPINTLGRLTTPDQFGEIIVRAVPGGAAGQPPRFVYLRDVARIEMGAQNYNQASIVDGYPSVGLAIYQLPGTNALDIAESVRQKMDQLSKRFPEGLEYGIFYDTTPFIEESVKDVVKTLFEAIILVAIVVLVFLQNWRATLIPLIAVPVAIVGTFSVMAMLGFSLNNISLFGLVLAIGIVVDDAIVVVENVDRWLEQGFEPKEAAHRAMEQVTGPVIAVAVVLCAVFIPCAFISGIVGQFFRQFAVTIAVSTVLSALNSLTLSPALAAILLKKHSDEPDLVGRVLDRTLGWSFRLFNRGLQTGTNWYTRFVSLAVRGSLIVLLVYVGLLGGTAAMFRHVPLGFVPVQDQGWLLVNVQLPDSASIQRTEAVMACADKIARGTPGVAHTSAVSGMSLLLTSNSSNFGSMFVILEPFDKRRGKKLHADDIINALRKRYESEIREAQVSVFGAPPVPGIGLSSGFKLMIEDRGSLGFDTLQSVTDGLIQKGVVTPALSKMFTLFRSATPQLYLDIDRTKAESLGISMQNVNDTLEDYIGSAYVNNFNVFGRYWQVNVQADGQFRKRERDIGMLKARSPAGAMVPLGTLAQVRQISGPVMVTRYNLYVSAPVNGATAPGISSGQVIKAMDALAANNLPPSMRSEWTDLTFMQIRAGNTAMYVFALAVVLVFLALAALYESWALPFAVILVVPMCLLCSLLGIAARDFAMDVFVQIGFVVLVGLACKNAILIVEFARELRSSGKPRLEATIEASGLRLRPILMTSFAFVLGVVPMVIAQGAGAEMRQSLGTAVFSGMLGVTLFGVVLTPCFFYVVEGIGELRVVRSNVAQRIGSVCIGGAAGIILGLLVWRTQLAQLHWAVVGGFSLGALTALLVQEGRRALAVRLRPRRASSDSDSAYPGEGKS